MEKVVIPIFSDPSLHPLHENNSLTAMYVMPLGESSDIFATEHSDGVRDWDPSTLDDDIILTPNKKFLLCAHQYEKVYDMDLLSYYLHNTPLDLEDVRVEAVEFISNRYYDLPNTNELVPLYKHLEVCDKVSKEIEKVWNARSSVDWESYERYNNEAITAFASIDRNGVRISESFDSKLDKHVSDGKLYSDYFLYTSTGRPSNSYGGLNFAALDDRKREFIVPVNDYLVEYDYDAYHLRIIAELVGYDFPEGSAHDHMAEVYGVDREEAKKISFKYLYGGLPWELAQANPFFNLVKGFTGLIWKDFEESGRITTPVFKRPLIKNNFRDMSRNKLFNYLIQATETEKNIKRIIEIQKYLYKKETRLILYTYDSFLIDFKEKEGVGVLKDIRNILEKGSYMTKSKIGYDYFNMKEVTDKLSA